MEVPVSPWGCNPPPCIHPELLGLPQGNCSLFSVTLAEDRNWICVLQLSVLDWPRTSPSHQGEGMWCQGDQPLVGSVPVQEGAGAATALQPAGCAWGMLKCCQPCSVD